MKKLTTVALALAAIGVANQASAFTTTANVTFTWGNNGTNKGWTSSGPNSLSAMSDATQFNTLAGSNSTGYYNSDFATVASAAAACAPYAVGRYRQYGCIDATVLIFKATPATDANNVSASGQLTVTPTTLTGVLTLNADSDECVGAVASIAAPGCGTTGWNVRSADGSPFGNVWQGLGASGGSEGNTTLTVNLTGTFTNVAGNWTINGGTVRVSDNNGIGCQMGNTGFAVLCNPSTVIGGYSVDGSALSWGVDLDGGGAGTAMGEIDVRDAAGNNIEFLSGVLASLSIDALGNITTNYGETRGALGSSGSGCSDHIKWDGSKISCGTLTVQGLSITGTGEVAVIPVPAAVWLFGSALGLLGVSRRKLAA